MRPTINYDIDDELHTLIEGLRTVLNQKLPPESKFGNTEGREAPET